ncbi:hypothetical protein [Ktedonobacter sp. SOSP1-52]|uniref:hypothetical protein n=1 Tax=Ktedonobacter sp. SOSP1-52 TaxID=2778366 RepID=UPI0019156015|nr:hypothetical protein [Ktedonobacter sp. SOSP1-52]
MRKMLYLFLMSAAFALLLMVGMATPVSASTSSVTTSTGSAAKTAWWPYGGYGGWYRGHGYSRPFFFYSRPFFYHPFYYYHHYYYPYYW